MKNVAVINALDANVTDSATGATMLFKLCLLG
jgi:hypothetical protein